MAFLFRRIGGHSAGFTLIELLVVISIISLLSSVSFSSLNSARGKAEDAKALQTVANIRTQFNLISDSYQSTYSGFCGDSRVSGFVNSVSGSCYSDGSGWAVYAPLKRPPAGAAGICIDITGTPVYRHPICTSSCTAMCGPVI